MPAIDIKNVTLNDLKEKPLQDLLSFQIIVNEAVEIRKTSEEEELRQKITALASSSGYSLEELFEGKSLKVKNKAPMKYRHPDDSSLVWAGRGRKPKWVVEQLSAGKKMEALEIK